MIYKKINAEDLRHELALMNVHDLSLTACDKILESYDNKEMSYDLLSEIKFKFFECKSLFDLAVAIGDEARELYNDMMAYQNSKVYDKFIQYIKKETEIFAKLGHNHWLIKLN